MKLAGSVFDRSGKVRRPSFGLLAREGIALCRAFERAQTGDLPRAAVPQTVLLLPPFLASDLFTGPFRRRLRRCGHDAVGWGLGPNWGPTPRILAGLRARLTQLRAAAGAPVTLIGISLGGILARDLAHDRPAEVRQVITLASPFALPTASTIEPLFHLAAPFYADGFDPARQALPLPVPSLAIYTRDDGIVAWESCHSAEADAANAEVGGPHMAICRNADALRLVARRLADPPVGRPPPSPAPPSGLSNGRKG